MKYVKDWIRILEEYKKCGVCGGANTIPTITPDPHEYTSDIFKKANSKRGIMILCNDCGAVASLPSEELEN